MRSRLDCYAHRAFASKQGQAGTTNQCGDGTYTVCGYLQRAARKHMEGLAWTNEKSEGGGDIIDLFIRARFVQGLYDDRIKTMVKAKGSVNTRMAQLVEVSLEDESAIKSERFKRNSFEKGQYENQENRNVPKKYNERKEVRTATVKCHRCNKMGHYSRQCRELPLSGGEEFERLERVAKNHDCRNTLANGQRGCLDNWR